MRDMKSEIKHWVNLGYEVISEVSSPDGHFAKLVKRDASGCVMVVSLSEYRREIRTNIIGLTPYEIKQLGRWS